MPANLNGRPSMNESDSRVSNVAPGKTGSGASPSMLWVLILTLPVTIIVLGIAFSIFGLLVRLL
jgi:hypothetical protein